MDSLKLSLTDLMATFNTRMANFEEELQKAPSSTVASLAAEFMSFKTFIKEALNSVSLQITSLAQAIDSVEMRGRRKMVLLHGVDEKDKEELELVVTNIVQEHLKVGTFTAANIKRCHRMGKSTDSSKPRPVLVKFVSVRDEIWFSKTKLKGSGVTMSEFLTRTRHAVFMAARERFGVNSCWTREGNIYILGPNSSRHRVVSLSDLDKIQVKTSNTEKPAEVSSPAAAPKKTKRAAATKKS